MISRILKLAAIATVAASSFAVPSFAAKGTHCKAVKRTCTFSDGRPREIGSSCVCTNKPRTYGSVVR
jgi:hypothetical protein